MNKSRFQVIKGRQASDYNPTKRFIQAHATNTRLMGVVGLQIQWETEDHESFYQIFHLDAEEYGLDDYIGVFGEDTEGVQTATAKIMGGLGGKLVPITENEARFLVRQYAEKSKIFKQELPEPYEAYGFMLKEKIDFSPQEIETLWEKICEPIETPTQLINYYVMRAVARDEEAMAYLSFKETIDYRPSKVPGTLIRNVVEPTDQGEGVSYMTESLTDTGDNYQMILSEIHVNQSDKGWKVQRAQVNSVIHITGIEVAFSLDRTEHISVYHVKNYIELMRRLDKEKPHAMKHEYEMGYLYTEFNPHNDHVKQGTYHLNDDVYGVYYVTEGSQLLVTAYSPERIVELEAYFNSQLYQEFLDLEKRLELDHTTLYEFVHSGYDNIFDFLEK